MFFFYYHRVVIEGWIDSGALLRFCHRFTSSIPRLWTSYCKHLMVSCWVFFFYYFLHYSFVLALIWLRKRVDQCDRMFYVLPVAEWLTIFDIVRCSAAFSSSNASGSIVKYCSVVGKWRTNDTVWERGHISKGAGWRVEASSLQS